MTDETGLPVKPLYPLFGELAKSRPAGLPEDTVRVLAGGQYLVAIARVTR